MIKDEFEMDKGKAVPAPSFSRIYKLRSVENTGSFTWHGYAIALLRKVDNADVYQLAKEFHNSLIQERKYANNILIPKTESLKDTSIRINPFLNNTLIPKLNLNNNILLSAHGNSIRAIMKVIQNINDEEISNIDIPTGKPILIKYSCETKKFENFKYLN